MFASDVNSINNSDSVSVSNAPATSSTTPTFVLSDNTPLVKASRGPISSQRILRTMGDLFRIPGRSTEPESGYVEFGHLENEPTSISPINYIPGSVPETVTNPSQKRTLGTFSGVFSPVALSMFSALIFIRVGYIVGNAGLLITLLQFGIAYVILIFTVTSVCAICTNGAVEGGGAYFMISRTLGPEFGGSIGTLFFFANIVSSALCITGCTEGLVENFGPSGYLIGEGHEGILQASSWYRLLYCSVLNGISLCLCLIGATMFAKTSVLILAIVSLCLASVLVSFFIMPGFEVPIPDVNNLVQNSTYHINGTYTGLNQSTLMSNIYSDYGKDYTSLHGDQVNFAAVFGVLFSGVTGIMAGANMSGELKNPAQSIPWGTLSAILFTFLAYIALAILTAATCSRFLLQNNYMYMLPINIWPPFVAIGLLTATFSAALSNLIGGSRVLEALAKDKVFGRALNFVSDGTFRGNPIVAVLITWLLVQVMIFTGSLNLIAQINSVLFLLSYLATNLACIGLQFASAPNFRPSFKFFSVHTAGAGLLGSFAMMFVINPAYAGCSIAACIVLVAALHLLTSERGGQDTPYWGSISQALIFHQVRKYLLLLDSRKDHVKYWRPQILLLVSSPRTCCPLIDFINDIKKSGLYVIGHIDVPAGSNSKNILDVTSDPTIKEYPHWLELVDFLKVKAFVEVTLAVSIREGFQHLVRISGMGAMKPNTIVLGFYDDNKPIDFFNSDYLPYRTTIFDTAPDGTITKIFPIQNKKQLDIVQYVAMISDTLLMGKNVCLCRHFDSLDKSAIAKNNNIKYIDVWTINVVKPNEMEGMASFDKNSLFMMQLAVICSMVSVWKKMKLRVFVRCKNIDEMTQLEDLLKMLRIPATIHDILNWETAINKLQAPGTATYGYDTDDESLNNETNYDYIRAVNQIIREKSQGCTAVSFIYLPCPPCLAQTSQQEPNHFIKFYDTYLSNNPNNSTNTDQRQLQLGQSYLKVLTELTQNLPPTVLVHGLNAVTSTTL